MRSKSIKALTLGLCLLALSACSDSYNSGRAVLFVGASDYPDELFDDWPELAKINLKPAEVNTWFGNYRPWLDSSAYFANYMNHPYRHNLMEDEVVAWWRVPTSNGMLYYYARSLPEQGIQPPSNGIKPKDIVNIGISFGPMRVHEKALTEITRKQATHARTSPGGLKWFRWGEPDKLYYQFLGRGQDRDAFYASHITWHSIQAIAITEAQYDALDKRCNSDWLRVRCFMDAGFPELTPEQKAYIQQRQHQDDTKRLDGTIPKPPFKSNAV